MSVKCSASAKHTDNETNGSQMQRAAALTVVNTKWRQPTPTAHFESLRANTDIRIAQIEKIFLKNDCILPVKDSCIVAGDFNFDSISPERERIPEAVQDVWATLNPGEKEWHPSGYTRRNCRLDKALCRSSHSVLLLPESMTVIGKEKVCIDGTDLKISDHNGLYYTVDEFLNE